MCQRRGQDQEEEKEVVNCKYDMYMKKEFGYEDRIHKC